MARSGLLGCNAIANTSEGNSILTEQRQRLFARKEDRRIWSQAKFMASIFPKKVGDDHRGRERLRTKCDWTSFEQMGNTASKAPQAVRRYPSPSILTNHSASSTPAQTKVPFPLPAQTTEQPANVRAKLEGRYLRKES